MTKKEIVEEEKMNFGKIILHREGAFWIAYERSAYWFYTNVRKYRPTKKYIHSAGCEIVSLGFPEQGWAQHTPNVNFIEKTDNRIVLETKVAEDDFNRFLHNFDEWKFVVDLPVPKAKKTAQHENLPVYKAIYDLTLKIFQSSQHMQRDYRYTLGEKIKKEAIDLLTAVFSANVSEDKEPHIREAQRLIEVIRLQLRLLRDLGQIAIKHIANINRDIEDIVGQLTAWQKAVVAKMIKRMEPAIMN